MQEDAGCHSIGPAISCETASSLLTMRSMADIIILAK
jgi:hypothetical protein